VRGRVSVRCRMTRRWESKGNSVCIRHIGSCVGRVSRQKRGRRERGRLSNLAWANHKAGGIAAFLASALTLSPTCTMDYCIVLPRLTADACLPARLPACLVHAHAAVLRSSCRRPMQLQMHCASFGRSKHPQSAPRLFNGAAQLTQAVQPLPPCTAADMDASGYRAGYRVQGCSF
jgi:hypothetical protein